MDTIIKTIMVIYGLISILYGMYIISELNDYPYDIITRIKEELSKRNQFGKNMLILSVVILFPGIIFCIIIYQLNSLIVKLLDKVYKIGLKNPDDN